MNSSISSSRSRSEGAWRRFAATFVLVAALVLAAVVALAYAVDPYDTGRSTLFAKPGVRPQGPRTAAASRGRDGAFNAAIVGNSHVQLLSPERLKAKTGLAFVQLSVPATGPREHLVLVDWFLRHRAAPRALVLGTDVAWCTADRELANDKPFPFWLYTANPLAYARGLVRFDILEELPRRLGYVFGKEPERARPDGYWNYETDYLGLGYGTNPTLKERLEVRPGDGAPSNGTGRFPAAQALRELASALPRDTALVIVFPPNYSAFQPTPGTARAAADEACKAALRDAVAARSGSAVVDWRVDRPENRDPGLYFDQTHYRQPIAEAVENDIAAALRPLD
jgi:hypothetical protein